MPTYSVALVRLKSDRKGFTIHDSMTVGAYSGYERPQIAVHPAANTWGNAPAFLIYSRATSGKRNSSLAQFCNIIHAGGSSHDLTVWKEYTNWPNSLDQIMLFEPTIESATAALNWDEAQLLYYDRDSGSAGFYAAKADKDAFRRRADKNHSWSHWDQIVTKGVDVDIPNRAVNPRKWEQHGLLFYSRRRRTGRYYALDDNGEIKDIAQIDDWGPWDIIAPGGFWSRPSWLCYNRSGPDGSGLAKFYALNQASGGRITINELPIGGHVEQRERYLWHNYWTTIISGNFTGRNTDWGELLFFRYDANGGVARFWFEDLNRSWELENGTGFVLDNFAQHSQGKPSKYEELFPKGASSIHHLYSEVFLLVGEKDSFTQTYPI